jgi:hypothetical protein
MSVLSHAAHINLRSPEPRSSKETLPGVRASSPHILITAVPSLRNFGRIHLFMSVESRLIDFVRMSCQAFLEGVGETSEEECARGLRQMAMPPYTGGGGRLESTVFDEKAGG